MPGLPASTPTRGFDDTCLTRPLVLKAALVMAGHQIRGTMAPVPDGPAAPNEEGIHHG
jgi:hypothetical protein